MWERLTEIALFSRSKRHRAPAEILKAFIDPKKENNPPLNQQEIKQLRRAFDFLAHAYRRHPSLRESKLATDQPQFYTLVTSLLNTDILKRFDKNVLADRVAQLADIVDADRHVASPPTLRKDIREYRDLAARQTTHPARREKREEILTRSIEALG